MNGKALEESDEVEFAFEQAHQLLNEDHQMAIAIPTLLGVKEGDCTEQDIAEADAS